MNYFALANVTADANGKNKIFGAELPGLIPIIAIVKFLCYDKNLRVGGNQQ